MRILFAGSPEVALPTLEYLHNSNHELISVISRPDAASGRGRKIKPSAVSAYAREKGLPLKQFSTLRTPEAAQEIAALRPDLGVVVAYGAIIPQQVLDIPTHGWINIHFSLLPRWRGAAPVQYAINAGDDHTGITIFQLEEGLDTGPFYCRVSSPLQETENSGAVLTRLGESAPSLLGEVLARIDAGETPSPQEEEGITLAPRITVAQAQIDWNQEAAAIIRQVRAFNPSPMAWTTDHHGARLKIVEVSATAQDTLSPGQIAATKKSVQVGTATTDLLIETVIPAGKSQMEGAAWARGARLEGNEKLGES